jgi:hypothetical protein
VSVFKDGGIRGQIKISADNVTTADSLHADSMAGMEEG